MSRSVTSVRLHSVEWRGRERPRHLFWVKASLRARNLLRPSLGLKPMLSYCTFCSAPESRLKKKKKSRQHELFPLFKDLIYFSNQEVFFSWFGSFFSFGGKMAEPKNYDLLKTVFLLIWKEKKNYVMWFIMMPCWTGLRENKQLTKKKNQQWNNVEMIPPTSSGVIPAIGIRLTRPLLLLLLKYSEKYFI